VMTGPAQDRRKRAMILRALLACLAPIAIEHGRAHAQTLTPDLFRPVPGGFVSPQNSPLRKISDNTGIDPTDSAIDPASDDTLRRKDTRAPSRIGQVPSYGLPAASGASDSGFDSLNRTRKKPKLYPGQAKPKPSPGPGSPAPLVTASPTGPPPRLSIPPSQSANRRGGEGQAFEGCEAVFHFALNAAAGDVCVFNRSET